MCGGKNIWAPPWTLGRILGVSTRFSLSVENEQAHTRRDGQTCLAKPNSQARTRTRKFLSVQLTMDRIGKLTRLICTLLYVMTTRSSLRTAHHKLLLRIIGSRRKDRIGYEPLSYREVLERTGSERIDTTIRKRQLGFAGALVRRGGSRLSKRVMFGRLAVQGPKRGGRPATS